MAECLSTMRALVWISIAVKKHHDRGNLRKKGLIEGFRFQKDGAITVTIEKHESRYQAFTAGTAESAHLKFQAENRGRELEMA